jgi:hypothetical protein
MQQEKLRNQREVIIEKIQLESSNESDGQVIPVARITNKIVK